MATKKGYYVSRIVSWFSAGAASAVATKLALCDYADSEHEVVIATIGLTTEHPDSERFLLECQEKWYNGQEIVRLKSEKYDDTWDVWERTKYLVGPMGARCTGELKKKVRYAFERPDDLQVFGFTADPREINRAERFKEQNPGVNILTPLIEHGLTKSDCLAMVDRAGIEIPEMYKLGYKNNNCIGCVKGGIGYWNKIRRDFPETFDRMADLERRLGNTVLRDKNGALFLDTLDPGRGNHADEPQFECGITCEIVEQEVELRSFKESP